VRLDVPGVEAVRGVGAAENAVDTVGRRRVQFAGVDVTLDGTQGAFEALAGMRGVLAVVGAVALVPGVAARLGLELAAGEALGQCLAPFLLEFGRLNVAALDAALKIGKALARAVVVLTRIDASAQGARFLLEPALGLLHLVELVSYFKHSSRHGYVLRSPVLAEDSGGVD
jgi:hypothetical protein